MTTHDDRISQIARDNASSPDRSDAYRHYCDELHARLQAAELRALEAERELASLAAAYRLCSASNENYKTLLKRKDDKVEQARAEGYERGRAGKPNHHETCECPRCHP